MVKETSYKPFFFFLSFLNFPLDICLPTLVPIHDLDTVHELNNKVCDPLKEEGGTGEKKKKRILLIDRDFFFSLISVYCHKREANSVSLLLDLNREESSVVGLLNGLVETLAEEFDEISGVGLSGINAVGEEDGDEFAIRIVTSLSAGVTEVGVGLGAEGGAAVVGVHGVIVGVPAKGSGRLSEVVGLGEEGNGGGLDEGLATDDSVEHESLGEEIGVGRSRPKSCMSCISSHGICILIRYYTLKHHVSVGSIVPSRGGVGVAIRIQ